MRTPTTGTIESRLKAILRFATGKESQLTDEKKAGIGDAIKQAITIVGGRVERNAPTEDKRPTREIRTRS